MLAGQQQACGHSGRGGRRAGEGHLFGWPCTSLWKSAESCSQKRISASTPAWFITIKLEQKVVFGCLVFWGFFCFVLFLTHCSLWYYEAARLRQMSSGRVFLSVAKADSMVGPSQADSIGDTLHVLSSCPPGLQPCMWWHTVWIFSRAGMEQAPAVLPRP